MFAEELREQNQSLERCMAQQTAQLTIIKEELNLTSTRENSLKDEIAAVRCASEQRIKDLEASLASERQQREELSNIQGNAAENLKESLLREEALKEELVKQKASSERRLKELRVILGVEETPLLPKTHKGVNSNIFPVSLRMRFI